MVDAASSDHTRHFVEELDEAALRHMACTRRLLRCAVLGEPVGDDVLSDDGHLRCRFDSWLQRHCERFERLDADAARRLQAGHERMHDTARRLCRQLLAGEAVAAGVLDAFEQAHEGVVAALLRSHCRVGEPVFRLGGEEFLALLQVADEESAQRAVQRMLQALRDSPLRLADGCLLDLRVSIGMAIVGAEEGMAEALARADQALYAAKAAGRDTWRWATAAG